MSAKTAEGVELIRAEVSEVIHSDSPDSADIGGSQDVLTTASTHDLMDVRQRLHLLQLWVDEYEREDAFLIQRARSLDMSKYIDKQKGVQIANSRRRLRMKKVKEPLEISPDTIRKLGMEQVRVHFADQFAGLTKNERLLWMNNFLFIMTPQIRQLNNKLAEVRRYNSLGQQRNFLLGGVSGAGKTTYLDWYTYRQRQTVEGEYNHVPVVKVDAPKNNKTSKPLFERIIRECGMNYLRSDGDEDLLMKVVCFFQVCGVELLILDEIEQISSADIKRRVLEISNLTTGVPIICASCHPMRWIEGDVEIAGRWNDYFELTPYKGTRLSQLLSFIELFLPFSRPSMLSKFVLADEEDSDVPEKGLGKGKRSRKSDKVVHGPAKLIEDWTGGVLREIMVLITSASKTAIEEDLPCVTPSVLGKTMKAIRTKDVPRSLTGVSSSDDEL